MLLEGALIPGGGGGGGVAEAEADDNEEEEDEEAVAVGAGAAPPPAPPPPPDWLPPPLLLAWLPDGLGSFGALACRGFDHAFMGAAFMVCKRQMYESKRRGGQGQYTRTTVQSSKWGSSTREPMPLCEKVSSKPTTYLTVHTNGRLAKRGSRNRCFPLAVTSFFASSFGSLSLFSL
jgi:hypothetical protein